ncbi:MAG: hypothetical protein PHS57_06125 [Alphaproteobacteria bacterium]|nr:hypothetical protein [Alphaproteobacteria bacterium]
MLSSPAIMRIPSKIGMAARGDAAIVTMESASLSTFALIRIFIPLPPAWILVGVDAGDRSVHIPLRTATPNLVNEMRVAAAGIEPASSD